MSDRVMFHFNTGLDPSEKYPDATFASFTVRTHLLSGHRWFDQEGAAASELLAIHRELHRLEFDLFPTWAVKKET